MIDETKLTAYALNELSPEDRAQIESELADDTTARQTIADIQATAALLTTEFSLELAAVPLQQITLRPAPRRWATAAIGLAAAAAAAIAAGLGIYSHRADHQAVVQAIATAKSVAHQQTVMVPAEPLRDNVTISSSDNYTLPAEKLGTGQTNVLQVAKAASGANGPIDLDDSKNTADTAGIVSGQHGSDGSAGSSANSKSSRFKPVSVTQSNVADDTTFRDANGNVVASASAGSKTLDWISNVGNAAVPGSVPAKSGQRQDAPYDDIIRYSPDWPTIGSTRDEEEKDRASSDSEVASLTAQLDHHLPELRFNTNSLSDVIDFMRDVTGSNIVVDWPSLQKAGITRDTPITARLRDIKFCDAMAIILKSASTGADKAGYKVEHGVISISVGPDYRLDHPIVDDESYSHITDNPFLASLRSPLSTFAVDVDTASYANVRRFIENGQMPPVDAVRIEELINYFPYSTPSGTSGPKPTDADPLAVHVEVAECPWQREHQLARISLKAKPLSAETRPPGNLVFLIDVSGSMADANKLPLLKVAIKKLVGRLTANDRVSIVTYAGNAQTALSSTPCSDDPIELPNKNKTGRQQILDAIDALNADGETNGGDGIQLAYKTAVGHFIKGGVNRVILCTDGDFNVGITDPAQLTELIESEATTGVYLTVLGVGMGNVKDSTMEQLANHGKGNYAYLDSQDEAEKVLGRQIDSTLVAVAKDVKLQVEFNPAKVAAYRLIGYEHRAMPSRDFANDKKNAGEMGAGHSVVALYELIPANGAASSPPLKYQPASTPATNPAANELMTVNVRYQSPEGTESRKLEVPVTDQPFTTVDTTNDFRFSAAVAAFGMILRDSPYRGDATLDRVITQASSACGEDVGGYRAQFIALAKRTKTLCRK